MILHEYKKKLIQIGTCAFSINSVVYVLLNFTQKKLSNKRILKYVTNAHDSWFFDESSPLGPFGFTRCHTDTLNTLITCQTNI